MSGHSVVNTLMSGQFSNFLLLYVTLHDLLTIISTIGHWLRTVVILYFNRQWSGDTHTQIIDETPRVRTKTARGLRPGGAGTQRGASTGQWRAGTQWELGGATR